ncbi:hypothetical protein [Nonomuraea sp. NPDC050540]|uniref:hypothetical protein n=1 Tax=Nonomuraea sp. NPDC050540 TaxID=3364367 RepID=UPI003794A10E
MSGLHLPPPILKALLPVCTLIQPMLAEPFTRAQGQGAALSAWSSRANPAEVRCRITAVSAVYVAWDVRRTCRYVGSVCREGSTAVGDRLSEHYRDRSAGASRRADWALLTVLPLHPDLHVKDVRIAEGWAARRLGPLDGSAHPMVNLATPPASLLVPRCG